MGPSYRRPEKRKGMAMDMDHVDERLMEDQQVMDQPLIEDRETAALAVLYKAITAHNSASRKRRIDKGEEGFTDLDAAGQRNYIRDRQKGCRDRQKEYEKETGFAPLSIESIRGAVLDAAMLMIAAGDPGADTIVKLASKAFELPSVASLTIRKKALRHRRKTLTEQRLKRAADKD